MHQSHPGPCASFLLLPVPVVGPEPLEQAQASHHDGPLVLAFSRDVNSSWMQMWILMDAHSGGGVGNLWKRLRSCELRMTVKMVVRGLLQCFSGKKSR